MRQRVELLCCGGESPVGAGQLPLSDHVHRLDTRQQDPRASQGFKTQHGPSNSLDGTMVLLDNVIQILALTPLNVSLMAGVVAIDCGGVGTTLVDRDLLGFAVPIDRPPEETASGRLVSAVRQQEVD